MKRRSLIALILALALVVSACAFAEGGKYYNETGMPIVNEPITITVAGEVETLPYEGQLGFDYLEEVTGLQFEIVANYATDARDTTLALMLSSDTMPDIIFKTMMDRSDANKWGEQGYFLDYMEYIDLMPNMAKYIEEHPDAAKMELTADGKLYGHALNRTSVRSSMLAQPSTNIKWLEAVGKEMPATPDELYDVLVAFRDEDPNGNGEKDEVPMGLNFSAGGRILWQLREAWGIVSCDNSYCLQADENGKVYLAETTEGYRDFLRFMNKLYSEELINQDAFIMSDDEYAALLGSGNVGMSLWWGPGYRTQYNMPTKLDFTLTYRPWPGMAAEGYTDAIKMVMYPANSGQARVQISAKTQYPEAICRFIDYICYTFEGQTLWEHGKEGIDYDIVTDEFGVQSINKEKYLAVGEASPVTPTTNIVGYVPTLQDEFFNNATNEELEKIMVTSEEHGTNAVEELYVRTYDYEYGFPFLAYTADEYEKIGNRKADITTYIQAQEVAFITGEADIEEDWETFQETLKMMGAEDLVAIAQDAYDRLG